MQSKFEEEEELAQEEYEIAFLVKKLESGKIEVVNGSGRKLGNASWDASFEGFSGCEYESEEDLKTSAEIEMEYWST